MSFEYEDKTDAVVSVLKKHNDTTTAATSLSKGLAYRIKDDDIEAASPENTQLRATRLPHIFVRPMNATENFEGIGPTGATGVKKGKDVVFDVIGFVGKHGGHRAESDLDRQAHRLARNIEDVLREEYTLSGTAMWCNAESTDFLGPFTVEGSQVKTVWVKVRAKYLFR